MYLVVSQAHCF